LGKIGHRHRENQCRHPLLMPPLQKEEWWRDEFTYKILMHPDKMQIRVSVLTFARQN